MVTKEPIELDCSERAKALATYFRLAPYWRIPETTAQRFLHETLKQFRAIEANVQFVHGDEPYTTVDEMVERLEAENIFLVRWRCANGCSHPLGAAHMLFRAVHDWYTHRKYDYAFDLHGELQCFEQHRRDGAFSRETLPLVWSEVVLENAYHVYHGHWYQWYKPVLDPHWKDWEKHYG